MKVAISYPPLESPKGVPMLSQNRQFQWFSDPTYIYPVIPASAATLLAANGYEVFWDDAIAEGLSYAEWKERIVREKTDIIAIETKTPIVKRHWKIIDDLKNLTPNEWNPKIVLMGDHATALPEESLKNSKVDFVLCGGDYDFLLLKLLDNLTNLEKTKISRIIRDDIQHSLDELPPIDRELTKWKLYSEKNGNFKHTPGGYVMNGRDCWWGKCSFCSWTTLFPGEKFLVRSAKKALDEIGALINLGVREIMEDSGTLPIGEWLQEFCHGMIERGYSEKVKISCNMRLNAIKNIETYKLMKKAGFRMILFGLESANQKTLDQINKNLKVDEIESGLKICKAAGLEPHITVMVGFPWETKKDIEHTLSFVKKLFRRGYIDTLQATLAIPYPGTPLYKYCKDNNLLLTEDYNRFDQREPVMKTDLSAEELLSFVKSIFKTSLTPKFLLRKIFSIRSWSDMKYFLRAARKVVVQIVFGA